MTREDIRTAVIGALRRVAPEIDPAEIQGGANFREEFDLDSMDVLNFVLALHAATGIDVPETDYARLSNLEAAVDYLAAKQPVRPLA